MFAHPAARKARHMDRSTTPTHYEIHVHGVLSDTLLVAFPELDPHVKGHDTVLVGALADQAALHGVLNRIEALGIELLEVRRRRG
jgi:hypothetical protein